MITRIENLLKSNSRVTDYRLNINESESYELFFVHRKLETVRSTDTTEVKVTVFVEKDELLGDATFSVYSAYTDEDIARAIDSACDKASLAGNKPYPLPADETLTKESDSDLGASEPCEIAAKIAEAVFAADSYENGSLNATEVFLYKNTVTVKNSRGINKTEVRHSAMVEAIPTWNGEGGAENSVELYECYRFTELDPDAITAEIDKRMQEVRDRCVAVVPEEKPKCRIVLPAEELSHLVGNISSQLNFSGAYNHTAAYKLGDAIQNDPKGDLLTVTMCGQMKGSTRSAAFDADGVSLTDAEVIKDGVAVGNFGGARYAAYMGEKPTGNLGCMRAECGTLTDEELKSQPYFRCASMSGLQLDIYNDYIGGEVRLAYYFDGEREIPMTGISISGKLSEALADMKLSTEETVFGGYKGPKLASFGGINVV